MAVLTIREKNQVTIPRHLLQQVGLRPGDPIEFEALPGRGIAIYPFGHGAQRESAWDLATALAKAVPGIEDTELELPSRDLASREISW
jgi:AbrB family looped-hinge helix DNA binding protein